MKTETVDALATRDVEAEGVHAQFVSRWSPRAMSARSLTQAQVAALAEAARWAPSCFNSQPWRFVYATRESERWDDLLGLLMDMNQAWAHRAGALFAVGSKTHFEHNGEPAPTHQFDAGAAWMSLALQARHLGLVSHAMWGFEHEKAGTLLGFTDEYRVNAMVAVGYPGAVDDLPERYRERESPSPRKPLRDILFENRFIP